MARTPEGRIKDAVKKLLKERGVWFFMPVQNGMGQVGIPDFICCADGTFVAIETKAPGKLNNTTPNQQRVLREIGDHGGHSLVVDNAEDVKKFFDEVLKI